MKESTLVAQIQKALEAIGAYVVKQHGSALTRAGVPDLLVCYYGYFIGLEVKTAKGRASKKQKHEIGRILQADGIATVVRSVKEAVEKVQGATR